MTSDRPRFLYLCQEAGKSLAWLVDGHDGASQEFVEQSKPGDYTVLSGATALRVLIRLGTQWDVKRDGQG